MCFFIGAYILLWIFAWPLAILATVLLLGYKIMKA